MLPKEVDLLLKENTYALIEIMKEATLLEPTCL